MDEEDGAEPLVHKVDCVRFYVPDLDAGLEFYRDHLGHQLLWRTDKAVGLGMSGTDAEIVLQLEREGQETDLKVDSTDAATVRVQDGRRQGDRPALRHPYWALRRRRGQMEQPHGAFFDSTKGLLLTEDRGCVTGTG